MKTKLTFLLALLMVASPAFALTPVCTRTAPIRDFIAAKLDKACADVTAADLETIKRIAVPRRKITEVKPSDFDDLPNLEIVNLVGNKLETLPEGVFAKLPNLKTLVLFGNPLKSLPDDFLENNPKLENLHMFRVPLKTLSESVISRLANMQDLKVLDLAMALNAPERERLRQIFPENGKVQLTFY